MYTNSDLEAILAAAESHAKAKSSAMVNFDIETLIANSSAYRAYLDRELLPEYAPELAYRPDDVPIVHAGERFCRVASYGRTCGEKVQGMNTLSEHLFKEHGVQLLEDEDKPKEQGMGKNDLLRLDAFYRRVMRDEDYEDKGKKLTFDRDFKNKTKEPEGDEEEPYDSVSATTKRAEKDAEKRIWAMQRRMTDMERHRQWYGGR